MVPVPFTSTLQIHLVHFYIHANIEYDSFSLPSNLPIFNVISRPRKEQPDLLELGTYPYFHIANNMSPLFG